MLSPGQSGSGDADIRRAVIGLCANVGKPILKLTDDDYEKHELGYLLRDFGSAYRVNIKIFNVLGTMVYSEEGVNVFNRLTKTLDLSSLLKGIYHLKVEGTRGTSIIRVIIDR